jgi:type VI secretion system protein ImpM
MPDWSLDTRLDERVGWYGKIPALGDFASRRLPTPFVHAWDDWLQSSIAESRNSLGEAWLSTYLHGPIWRFILMAGTCGERAWIGILMPSVDRVGRYFPLTIAADMGTTVAAVECLASSSDWFGAAEAAALGVLDPQATIDSFEARMMSLPAPDAPWTHSGETQALAAFWANRAPADLTFVNEDAVARTVGASLLPAVGVNSAGGSIFWSTMHASNGVAMRCFASLPPPMAYADMIAVR